MAIKKSQLYSSLWASCDELRGGMDASQYKDYILTLLFMKYVSDKYAGKPDAVIEVPKGGSFADMVNLKGDKEIGEKISKIISKLAEANDLVGVIDVADFNDEDKLGKGKEMQDRLSKLIGIFESLDFSANRAEGDDLLGDAYEYLMRHFATESGKSKGQFYTPAEVSRIMAQVVGIGPKTRQDQTIYDPTCGSGSLLLKAADQAPRGLTIYGQENDVATWALARMNMILHGHATADLWRGNTLSDPHFKEPGGGLRRFDFAVANPPFSAKAWTNGVNTANDEFHRFDLGVPPAKNGDYAFLLHLITSLKSNGTYLYIDKQMHDHGLFQAICRVNRLDSEDKEYGYVIDYKDLFKALEKSIHDYTGEAFAAYDAEDVQGLLTDRLTKSKEHLEELRESVKALCEPVAPPKDTINYVHYFCGKSGDGAELEDNEQKRVALYKTVAALLRAYADLANEMTDAGYSEKEAQEIKEEVTYYEKVREEIKLASGDYVDMKVFEPAMRHLLDTYIKADESKKLSAFDDMTLVQLVVDQGERAVEKLPDGLRKDPEAMAEAIENNVRRLIIDESPVNPKYFEKMSELLEALIKERKEQALHYTEYLGRIAALARKVQKPETTTSYPSAVNTGSLRALYDNLDKDEQLAIRVDAAIRAVKKDGWRGNRFKEREVRGAIKSALDGNDSILNKIFEIAKAQREY